MAHAELNTYDMNDATMKDNNSNTESAGDFLIYKQI